MEQVDEFGVKATKPKQEEILTSILTELKSINSNLERVFIMLAREKPTQFEGPASRMPDVGAEVQKQVAAARAAAERAAKSVSNQGAGAQYGFGWPTPPTFPQTG